MGPVWLAAAVLVALLASCLPIPDVRLPLDPRNPPYAVSPASIATTFEVVPGYDEPSTPDAFDRSYVLRYHSSEPADAVLVLVPGIFGGATSMDPLARQLVAAVPGLEVWTLDRRANGLEDRTGFRRAIAARDPGLALRYYVGDGEHAPEFAPRAPSEVGFMSDWGLAVHLADLDAVVTRAQTRAPHVFLGGHSLGASIASVYASYRTADGRTGADRLAGLVLIDGTLGRTGAYGTAGGAPGLLGSGILPTVEDIEDGSFPPFLDAFLGPEYFVRRGVIAQLGFYRPLDHAPDQLAWIPMTNRALAGASFDDGFFVPPLFGASLGEPVDGVYDGNLPAFLLAGTEGAYSRSLAGVAPGADRVDWTAGDPATEHTDLRDFSRAWTHPSADYNEWYFPLRLGLELAELDPRLEGQAGFVPTADVSLPTIGFGAGRGLVSDRDGFSTYLDIRYGAPISTYVLPDFTHLDIVSARQNPVVPVLARWMASLPGGR